MKTRSCCILGIAGVGKSFILLREVALSGKKKSLVAYLSRRLLGQRGILAGLLKSFLAHVIPTSEGFYKTFAGCYRTWKQNEPRLCRCHRRSYRYPVRGNAQSVDSDHACLCVRSWYLFCRA